MKYIFTVLFICCLLPNCILNAFAVNTDFSTEKLSEQDIQVILDNVNITLLTEEPVKQSIECFDVRADKTFAVGFSCLDDDIIAVYNVKGDFEYGYTFKSSGDFYLEWDNDIINIYFVRGDIAVSVNAMGEVENTLKIQNTIENSSYWNKMQSNKRNVGDTKYTLKNDMGILNLFASSYSQLVTENIDGEEMIIYDVNSSQFLNTVVLLVFALTFIGVLLLIVFYNLKKSSQIYRD